MSANPDLLNMIATVFGMVYPFWPVVLVGVLISQFRRPLRPLLIIWVVMLICWAAARLVSAPPLMKLIPEPLSTVLFFAAGVIIVGLFIFRKVFRLRNQPRTSSYNRR